MAEAFQRGEAGLRVGQPAGQVAQIVQRGLADLGRDGFRHEVGPRVAVLLQEGSAE